MAQRQFRSDDTDQWSYKFGNGADGAYSSAGNATDAPIDSSCSGTATQTSLSATNASFAAGQLILIHQTRGTGAGNWELNRIESYVAGTITLSKALMNTYTDSGASQAQVLVMKQYTTFTQNSGHTLTAKAWDGNVGGIIAFFAKTSTTITGSLNAVGKGYIGGNGGTTASDLTGYQGESIGQASDTTRGTSANNNGGGGGETTTGSDIPGTGGAGGHGTSGGNGASEGAESGGTGGGTAGVAGLTTMVFGGGAGGSGANANSSTGRRGGYGSGIVFIVTPTITITGSITTNGGQGVDGSSGANVQASSGGAGGSILVKCKTATLGTALVTSSGGAGGGNTQIAAATGGVGRIHLDYSVSYTGTTSPTLDATQDLTITDASTGSLFFSQL